MFPGFRHRQLDVNNGSAFDGENTGRSLLDGHGDVGKGMGTGKKEKNINA